MGRAGRSAHRLTQSRRSPRDRHHRSGGAAELHAAPPPHFTPAHATARAATCRDTGEGSATGARRDLTTHAQPPCAARSPPAWTTGIPPAEGAGNHHARHPPPENVGGRKESEDERTEQQPMGTGADRGMARRAVRALPETGAARADPRPLRDARGASTADRSVHAGPSRRRWVTRRVMGRRLYAHPREHVDCSRRPVTHHVTPPQGRRQARPARRGHAPRRAGDRPRPSPAPPARAARTRSRRRADQPAR